MFEITSIILAAGEGKRMKSALPKVLHPVCGRPAIDYSVQLAQKLGSKKILTVVSKLKSDLVLQHLKNFKDLKIVFQSSPMGTGHAVQSCVTSLNGSKGYVLILYGDVPLIQEKTLKQFLNLVSLEKATLGLITTVTQEPQGYGRIVRDSSAKVLRIVEEKEASQTEKQIQEINTGIYAVKTDWLLQTLKKLKPHPVSGEYYLTDIVEAAIQNREPMVSMTCNGLGEFLGINTRKQLSEAIELMKDRLIEKWMTEGVTFIDPRHVYIDSDVTIGQECVIHPQVYLQGKTEIGKNCVIECGAVLKDMVVGDNVHIKPYCVLEESIIESEAQIGPFARLRPGSQVGKKARVGNFVELKKTKLGAGAKANHLSYLGDADIGAETNVGCGTITCNYDGVKKHPTKIGKKVFVGSDVQFVAPVKVGDGAYIGAGSTITEDVPSGALAIARQRQVNKKGWAKKKNSKS